MKYQIWRNGFPVYSSFTNDSGFFSVSFSQCCGLPNPFVPSVYSVLVTAESDAAIGFFQAPPAAPATVFTIWAGNAQNATSPSAVLSFNKNFSGQSETLQLSMTEVLVSPFRFANNHRDPTETDNVGKVFVQPSGAFPPPGFYDPNTNTINLGSAFYFQDSTIVHEYGHFLQERISKFMPLPSNHNSLVADCAERAVPFGPLINSGELAWMEGFPNWIVLEAAREFPNTFSTTSQPPGSGIAEVPSKIEGANASNCAGVVGQTAISTAFTTGGVIDATMTEPFVWAVLMDLSDPFVATEPWEASDSEVDTVFQIFDKEQDLQTSGYPTLTTFVAAWAKRGKDIGRLERIMSNVGIPAEQMAPIFLSAATEVSAPAARNWTGGTSVYHRGTDFNLYERSQTGPDTGFTGWASRGGSVWGGVSVFLVPVAFSTPQHVAFYRGIDYKTVSHRMPDGQPSWIATLPDLPQASSTLLNPVVGNPLFVQRASGSLDVYVRDTDGFMWRSAQATPNSSFSSFTFMAGIATAGLGGAMTSSGRVEVVHRGTDYKYYRCVNPSTSTCSWIPMGTQTFSSAPFVVARNSGDSLVVCGRSNTGGSTPLCSEVDASGASGWTTVSSVPMGSAGSGSPIGLTGTAISLFYVSGQVGQPASVTVVEQNAPGGPWTTSSLGGVATSPLAVTRDSQGLRTVFARSSNWAIYYREESPTGVWPTWWTWLGGYALGFSGASSNVQHWGGEEEQ